MHIKFILLATGVALALPAIAQQTVAPQPAPAIAAPTPSATQAPSPVTSNEAGADESAVEEVSAVSLQPPAPPVEYPGWARRDPWVVGSLRPEAAGLGDGAWGGGQRGVPSVPFRRGEKPPGLLLGA